MIVLIWHTANGRMPKAYQDMREVNLSPLWRWGKVVDAYETTPLETKAAPEQDYDWCPLHKPDPLKPGRRGAYRRKAVVDTTKREIRSAGLDDVFWTNNSQRTRKRIEDDPMPWGKTEI